MLYLEKSTRETLNLVLDDLSDQPIENTGLHVLQAWQMTSLLTRLLSPESWLYLDGAVRPCFVFFSHAFLPSSVSILAPPWTHHGTSRDLECLGPLCTKSQSLNKQTSSSIIPHCRSALGDPSAIDSLTVHDPRQHQAQGRIQTKTKHTQDHPTPRQILIVNITGFWSPAHKHIDPQLPTYHPNLPPVRNQRPASQASSRPILPIASRPVAPKSYSPNLIPV